MAATAASAAAMIAITQLGPAASTAMPRSRAVTGLISGIAIVQTP